MDNPRRQSYSLKKDLSWTVKVILMTLWFSTPIWILFLRFQPPKFSVQLEGATGIDDGSSGAPAISAVFNLTLRADNRRGAGRCYSNGEAAVRYAGYTVAWGRTAAFCVGAREARAVPLVAWAGGGVGLPRSLRARLAADWRAAAAELEVDMKLFRADDGSGRPAWVSCTVTAGGAKPPGGAPCTVFALQNWASDVSPAWTSRMMNYF